jgi:hypothetical protein
MFRTGSEAEPSESKVLENLQFAYADTVLVLWPSHTAVV